MHLFHRMFLAALALAPLSAQAFSLQWPLDCTLGTDCFVQNYVDHDASTAAQDFTCGSLTYDKHDGTDIRLRTLAAMRAGVTVRAPADGVVLGARDGMADVSMRDEDPSAIKDRECGNGVRIQHADGYVTQLCHMKKGSILPHAGQQIKAGEAVGQVGLSGNTEFPHLHITVWKDKTVVDPFDDAPMASACNPAEVAGATGLWVKPAPYQATALLGDGFIDSVPTKEAMRDTPEHLAVTASNAPVLAYWVDIMGVRKGDVLRTAITAPDNSTLTEKTQTMEKPMALYFAFIGKRNSAGALPTGNYRAELTLTRGNARILHSERMVTVR